jgi:hypothetical protein
MVKIVPRIRGPRFSQQIYRLIYLAQKEMTRTQRKIIMGYERVMWTEPGGFLELGDCRLRLTEKHQRYAKLAMPARLIWIERNRRLQLDLGFV